MVVAHADAGFGSHGRTPPACKEHLSSGRVVQATSGTLFLTMSGTGSPLTIVLQNRVQARIHSEACACGVHTGQCHRNPLSE